MEELGETRDEKRVKEERSDTAAAGFSIRSLVCRREKLVQLAHKEALKRRGIAESLQPLFQRYGVANAYLFGSTIRGTSKKDSDLDMYMDARTYSGWLQGFLKMTSLEENGTRIY